MSKIMAIEGTGNESVYIGKNKEVDIFYKFHVVSSTRTCKCLATKDVYRYILDRVSRVEMKQKGKTIILNKKSTEANLAKKQLKKKFSESFCNNCLVTKQKQAIG